MPLRARLIQVPCNSKPHLVIVTVFKMSLTNNSLVNKPSLIEYEQLKFLIMDAPKESNLHVYIRECKKFNVTHIVRISEPSYSKEEVEEAGIQLHVCTWMIS